MQQPQTQSELTDLLAAQLVAEHFDRYPMPAGLSEDEIRSLVREYGITVNTDN